MSIAVSEVCVGLRVLRRESPALRRFLVGELPGHQYPIQHLYLLTRRCVPRRSLRSQSRVVATPSSISHSLSTLRPSSPERNSSILTVSLMYHEWVINVLPEHRQNVITVLLPLHHSIIQTSKHVVRSVS